jgi:hypothetical protein
MSRNKKGGPVRAAQGEAGGSLETAFVQSMLERIRTEAIEAARAEFKQQAQKAPDSPAIASGERGPLRGPNSRYSEPGVRARKRMGKEEEAKIWSGFMDRTIVEAFKEECNRIGVTQRFGAEQAFSTWVKESRAGKRHTREVSWKS